MLVPTTSLCRGGGEFTVGVGEISGAGTPKAEKSGGGEFTVGPGGTPNCEKSTGSFGCATGCLTTLSLLQALAVPPYRPHRLLAFLTAVACTGYTPARVPQIHTRYTSCGHKRHRRRLEALAVS